MFMMENIEQGNTMSKQSNLLSTLFISLLFLTACGGGGGSTSTSSTAPIAQISSGSEFVEGTTFIEINGGNSSDSNGSVETYQWTIEDNDGVSSIDISDPTSNSTQIIGIPAVISQDIEIIIGLVVTDNDAESSTKVTKTITIKNNITTVDVTTVDVSDFNGTWYSPCFNNRFGFSVRQTININGNSLTSDIGSYTAVAAPAPDCILPGTGLLIGSDATATLNYGSEFSSNACFNGIGVNTDINISSVNSSGQTYTSQADIADVLTLVTGYGNLLPNSTEICRTSDNNLLFADTIYTRGPNTTSVDVIEANIDVDSDVSWQAGNAVYNAGTGASASSISNDPNNPFGVLGVGTDLDSSNGSFSGSSLTITHSLSGSGLYTITDMLDGNSAKQVVINTSLGTATTQATAYDSGDVLNKVEVIVDADGKYHFTLTDPVFLNKGVEVNGGIPGAPATIDFTMSNIYDYSN